MWWLQKRLPANGTEFDTEITMEGVLEQGIWRIFPPFGLPKGSNELECCWSIIFVWLPGIAGYRCYLSYLALQVLGGDGGWGWGGGLGGGLGCCGVGEADGYKGVRQMQDMVWAAGPGFLDPLQRANPLLMESNIIESWIFEACAFKCMLSKWQMEVIADQ